MRLFAPVDYKECVVTVTDAYGTVIRSKHIQKIEGTTCAITYSPTTVQPVKPTPTLTVSVSHPSGRALTMVIRKATGMSCELQSNKVVCTAQLGSKPTLDIRIYDTRECKPLFMIKPEYKDDITPDAPCGYDQFRSIGYVAQISTNGNIGEYKKGTLVQLSTQWHNTNKNYAFALSYLDSATKYKYNRFAWSHYQGMLNRHIDIVRLDNLESFNGSSADYNINDTTKTFFTAKDAGKAIPMCIAMDGWPIIPW